MTPGAFIQSRLHFAPVRDVPELSLYTAHPGSGLGRIRAEDGGRAPYWAYQWAGGKVLARHVLDHPGIVAGLRVADLGAGGGIVAIAAARAGAAHVTAIEPDAYGAAACGLNAAANGVLVEVLHHDPISRPVPQADLLFAGDVFYNADVAMKMREYLDRCVAAGIAVLVGDPGRKDLPLDRLTEIARYRMADFGAPPGADGSAFVFRYG